MPRVSVPSGAIAEAKARAGYPKPKARTEKYVRKHGDADQDSTDMDGQVVGEQRDVPPGDDG